MRERGASLANTTAHTFKKTQKTGEKQQQRHFRKRKVGEKAIEQGKGACLKQTRRLDIHKNPCLVVIIITIKKKINLFKYEYYKSAFLMVRKSDIVSVGVGGDYYNSMSCASSSEKSDMELSEEESPAPSSCSFRASSVAYFWMYSLIFCLYSSGRCRYMAAASPFRGSIGLGYASSCGKNDSKMLVRS